MNNTSIQISQCYATETTGPSAALAWLDEAEYLLTSDSAFDVANGVRLTRDRVEFIRCSSVERWRTEMVPRLRSEPIFALLQEDPFSERSFRKPRGYAGDAELIDLIYRHRDAADLLRQASPRGRAMASFGTQAPAPRAVCNRLFAIGCEIDALASRRASLNILSVACGHLREAELSKAIVSQSFSRFVAIDQDPESIRRARAAYGDYGIDFKVSGLKPILTGKLEKQEGFDFIYAAGLFDYLDDRLAKALVKATFNLLKPGGKLWVPNFLKGIPDRGFMECFMDWWLIYRTRADLSRLSNEIDPTLVQDQRVFSEPEENIGFLELVRA